MGILLSALCDSGAAQDCDVVTEEPLEELFPLAVPLPDEDVPLPDEDAPDDEVVRAVLETPLVDDDVLGEEVAVTADVVAYFASAGSCPVTSWSVMNTQVATNSASAPARTRRRIVRMWRARASSLALASVLPSAPSLDAVCRGRSRRGLPIWTPVSRAAALGLMGVMSIASVVVARDSAITSLNSVRISCVSGR
jgi:hypothetical protein